MGEEIPRRKPTRLSHYDYGRSGAYFITICTHEKRCTLSRIVGEGSPLPQLTVAGSIAEQCILEINSNYPTYSVEHYVIMPNHIHMLILNRREYGRGDPSPTVVDVVAWLKYRMTKEINKRKGMNGVSQFQRSFHDHIIRDRDDYIRIAKYIKNNPKLWHRDCFYTPS